MPRVRSSASPVALLAAAVLVLSAALAAPPAARAQAPTRAQAVELGREAYRYGLPLLTYLDLRARQTAVSSRTGRALVPVNGFTNAGILATWWTGGTPFPNTDTLYSIAHADLGDGPVVLSHGDMTGRFFVFQLIDAYTNTFGYVGTRTTGSAAGRFALTWTGGPAVATPGAQTISSPTRRVWVIGRTLTTGGPLDVSAARAAQRTYDLEQVRGTRSAASAAAAAKAAARRARKAALAAHARAVRKARAAGKRRRARGASARTAAAPPRARTAAGAGSGGVRARIADVPTGDAFLDRLAHALRDNPPPAQDAPLLARLARSGIGPRSTPGSAGLPPDVVAGVRDGVNAEAAELPGAARARVLAAAVGGGGGWYSPPANFGNFGTDYGLRADSVIVGLAGNRPEEASYRLGLADSTGAELDGSRSYRITFPAEPPAQAFWSLTLYDLDGDLVQTTGAGRSAIGDTHPPLRRRADGSIVVAVQRTAPADGVNWLQAPDRPFRLDLRLYTPDASVLSGAWRPPAIERVG